MKIFIAYRYAGEDPSSLKETLEEITSIFKRRGISVFYSFAYEDLFQEKRFSYKQILDFALHALDESDYIFALIKSQEKSEGMLLELGYAYAKNKRIILAQQKDVRTNFLQELAEQTLSFSDLEDLYKQVAVLKLL